MPLLNFKKSLAEPQAVKTSVSEAAMRKVDKMFDNAAKPKINVSKTPPAQAVKVPGKMGPSQRNNSTDPKTRKDDKVTRGQKMRAHFKQILSGKAGRMLQGNK